MDLRPYQLEAKEAIESEWAKGVKKTLLVLPTGTGKTIVFCKLIQDLVAQGLRCLILAHRGELLEQAADKMRQATGLNCVTEKAGETAEGSFFNITVGSVQTLMRPERLERFNRDHYNVIIVDEAHHVLADSYLRIFDYFNEARVLGVTATPDRGDMKNLGKFFETIAFEYSLHQAIKDGFLSKIKALTLPLDIDMNQVGVQAGDFKAADVGNALDPYLEQISDLMLEHCADRKTVVFLPLIATSQKMLSLLIERGFDAVEVNGTSKDRKEVLDDFDKGRYQVLCNSMLLTEGWDCPDVDCIICLRPTKVRSLYCQIVGRGTRIAPNKDHLLLLDFLWHSDRHELCRPAYLIAESEEVARKATENLEAGVGEAFDIEDAVQQAESDCIADREEALAKKLRELRHRKKKLVDPLQFTMSISDQSLATYEPAFGWEMAPASDQQKMQLEKSGINPDEVDCAGKAVKILEQLRKRRDAGLTTAKQIRFLEKKGFEKVGKWKFEQARKLIDEIAGNRWRTPQRIGDPSTYVPPQITESKNINHDPIFAN